MYNITLSNVVINKFGHVSRFIEVIFLLKICFLHKSFIQANAR